MTTHSDPLTDDVLAAIRARSTAHTGGEWLGQSVADDRAEASADDVPALLAEVTRLRADLEELTEMTHSAETRREQYRAERDELRTELAELTADHLGHIDRVTRAAVDHADAMAAKLDAVRECHEKTVYWASGNREPGPEDETCLDCDEPWPCATIRALDAAPVSPRPPAQPDWVAHQAPCEECRALSEEATDER